MTINIVTMVEKKVSVDSVTVFAKVCDSGTYTYKDSDNNSIKGVSGYVPSFFPTDHCGDYLELKIDLETGVILNWNKPSPSDLTEAFGVDEE